MQIGNPDSSEIAAIYSKCSPIKKIVIFSDHPNGVSYATRRNGKIMQLIILYSLETKGTSDYIGSFRMDIDYNKRGNMLWPDAVIYLSDKSRVSVFWNNVLPILLFKNYLMELYSSM